MKKIKQYLYIILPVILIQVLLITACSGPSSESNTPTPSPTETQTPGDTPTPTPDETAGPAQTPGDTDPPVTTLEDFALIYKEFRIEMNQNINEIINALGEPLGIFEAPSCAFDGIDRIFSYPGLQIHTYPAGDSDFIHTMSLRDDSTGTIEGIYLGDSLLLMLRAYGDDYELEFGMYTFTRGLTTLSFLVEDEVIESITYGFLIDN